MEQLSAPGIPDSHPPVVAGGRQLLPRPVKVHGVDVVGVLQADGVTLAGHVPDAHCVVGTAGSDAMALGAEGDGVDLGAAVPAVAVAPEGRQFLRGAHMGDAY